MGMWQGCNNQRLFGYTLGSRIRKMLSFHAEIHKAIIFCTITYHKMCTILISNNCSQPNYSKNSIRIKQKFEQYEKDSKEITCIRFMSNYYDCSIVLMFYYVLVSEHNMRKHHWRLHLTKEQQSIYVCCLCCL